MGRGLRLCVDQNGDRMDDGVPGINVHELNILSVVASESYDSFARELQKQIAETLSDRPKKADSEIFRDNRLTKGQGQTVHIDAGMARKLYQGFVRNNYVDEEDNLTEEFA